MPSFDQTRTRREIMVNLNDIMAALARVETMMSSLAKYEAGDESYYRTCKEEERLVLMKTLNRVAEDLAQYVPQAAKQNSTQSNGDGFIRPGGSRRN